MWQCDKEHQWVAKVCKRTENEGCPVCSATGWTRAYLAYFLQKNFALLQSISDPEERRELFKADRAIINTGAPRAILEAAIEGKLNNTDVQSYFEREPSAYVKQLLDNHHPNHYKGKARVYPKLRREVYERDGYACWPAELQRT